MLSFSFQNLWRNVWLSLVTIFILTLALLSMSLLFTVNGIASRAIDLVVKNIDVNIFFHEEVKEKDILRARSYIESIPSVEKVTYISSEQAVKIFSKKHEQEEAIQETLKEISDGKILPASLVIKAKELDDYPDILVAIDNSEFNDFVKTKNFESYRDIIAKLERIISNVSAAGFIVSLFFALISILVIFNTIRMTIYTHREEIGIMKLVGATNGFIRGPFVVEGLLYAVFSSLITIGILTAFISVSSATVNAFLEGYDFDLLKIFYQYFWKILLTEFGIGIVVSIGSSMVAIGRYLRV